MIRTALAGAAIILLVASCRPPFPYTPSHKIPEVRTIDQLMWIQADAADPRFDLAEDFEDDPSKLGSAQYQQFIEMAKRIQATAKELPRFTKQYAQGRDADYNGFTKALSDTAAVVITAAGARDGAKTVEAVLNIRSTCRNCHNEFR